MKKQLPEEVKIIFTRVTEAGFSLFVVGGAVRDLLMDKQVTDWDFATDATPENIQKIFPDSFYDNAFGTVGVVLPPAKTVFEITTFRSEAGYSNFRHPDSVVWGKTIHEDLERRDFTINAIAYDGKTIIDPYRGQADLEARTIRAVRDPSLRFQEDALRMMRAIRIATELGFTIEEHTFAAIVKHRTLLTKISAERTRDELFKILASLYPADGIQLLRNADLLSLILPEIEACFGVEQKSPKRHHIFDVGTHLLQSLKHCPSKKPIVRLATLLHDIGKAKTFERTPEGVITFYNHEHVGAGMVQRIATRMRLSKKDADLLFRLVRFHQFTVDERQTDSAVRRFIRNVGKDYIEDMLALRIGDRLGGGARETSWRLELFKKRLIDVQKQPFAVSDLHVNGYDVMEQLHIPAGPGVGKALTALFEQVVAGTIPNDRTILLEQLKELSDVSTAPIKPKGEQQ